MPEVHEVQTEPVPHYDPEVSNLPDGHEEPQAERDAAEFEANEERRKKRLISPDLKPDDYAARVIEQRKETLDFEEKRLKEKHEADRVYLERQQEADNKALAAKRETLDHEAVAIKAHVEMWQRQADENAHATDAQRAVLVSRHEAERTALAKETGYEVLPPTLGDRTIQGFPHTPLPGHPWVRPIGMPITTRLHRES